MDFSWRVLRRLQVWILDCRFEIADRRWSLTSQSAVSNPQSALGSPDNASREGRDRSHKRPACWPLAHKRAACGYVLAASPYGKIGVVASIDRRKAISCARWV